MGGITVVVGLVVLRGDRCTLLTPIGKLILQHMRHEPAALLLILCATAYAMAEESAGTVAHPDWSPDGTQLAFEADWHGARNIYVMDIDGSHVRQLTFGEAMDTYPRYSSDGHWLVFLSRRHALFSMHLVRPDGTDERALLPADGNLEPAFSPDGRRVAFRSYLNGDDPDGEIMLVDVLGEHLRRLTDNTVEDGYPAFSADGRSLFFHRTVEDFRQIIMLDLETGAEMQLTSNDSNSWHAHASPDGRQIVYDGNQAGNRDIYLMDLENHRVTQLTSDPGRDEYPKFSPDGRRIAFHSDRGGSMAIYVMNTDGSEQAPVIPQWPVAKLTESDIENSAN